MTLARRIIPCLDVKDGRVVKGVNFVALRDAGDPVAIAAAYNDAGADELTFLDITASSDGRQTMIEVVRRTAEQVFIPLTVGGGVRTLEDIKALLRAGADKVSINTRAVQEPDFVAQAARRFGDQCIVVAIDAKAVSAQAAQTRSTWTWATGQRRGVLADENTRWEVFTHGGRNSTGIDVIRWAQYMESLGAGEILLTSMDRDGTKDGYDIELTRAVSDAVGIPVIASGGVGKLDHFRAGLVEGGASAVLAASVFHFNELTIRQVKEYLVTHGVVVRPVR